MGQHLLMLFNIYHHGAVNGVTGSCHELQWQDHPNKKQSILIDCGLFQGAETSADGSGSSHLQIPFPINHIQALVVTHVHIDHVGRIPYLLAAGFRGPIYCSEASAELLPLVLEDAVKIGFTKNKHLIEQFLRQIEKQIHPLAYKSWLEIPGDNNVKIKLHPAGHILGSAYVEVDLSANNNSDKTRITFSGDLGPPNTPLLNAPKPPYKSDVLVIESTYGDRRHESRLKRTQKLKQVIETAVKDKGVVLVPAFSIGRTQELLYEIEQIIFQNGQDKSWKNIEVIVDSPLAARFTATYRKLRRFWDKEARRRLKQGRHPLSFDSLLTIDDHATHEQTVKYLAKTARPTIVLAASGMCSGGRVVNYLKALIEDRRTDILFVGYQAQGTTGRIIQTYGPRNGYVDIDGKRYRIRAKVHTIGGYSAHADQKNLLDFIRRMRVQPREIRLVHGDEAAKATLRDKLKTEYPQMRVIIPQS